MSLADRRSDYEWGALDRGDLADEPVSQWWTWYEAAAAAGVAEPNAMSVATVAEDGAPDARMVLVRGVDDRGFAFFTNYGSRKGRQLDLNPWASLVFLWKELDRQVCVSGAVERMSAHDSDEYFASRPRDAQLGAWASRQSEPLADRAELDAELAAADARFPGEVPRPQHWGGFRVRAETIEFWQGRRHRLHDRFLFTRREDGRGWRLERLAP